MLISLDAWNTRLSLMSMSPLDSKMRTNPDIEYCMCLNSDGDHPEQSWTFSTFLRTVKLDVLDLLRTIISALTEIVPTCIIRVLNRCHEKIESEKRMFIVRCPVIIT